MVSLRRRKLLGLCSGKSSFLDPLPKSPDGNVTNNPNTSFKLIPVHPLPFDDVKESDTKTIPKVIVGSLNSSVVSGSSKEDPNKQPPEQPIKRRKSHRRKNQENQEECLMKGVYSKNTKFQAAIKVDKKQIHLGTVESPVEAARLYDRAAFMCGRELNFDLSEEEKQELRKLDWDEFLALTRFAITNKKHKRSTVGVASQKKTELPTQMQNVELNGYREASYNTSDSMDTSVSLDT